MIHGTIVRSSMITLDGTNVTLYEFKIHSYEQDIAVGSMKISTGLSSRQRYHPWSASIVGGKWEIQGEGAYTSSSTERRNVNFRAYPFVLNAATNDAIKKQIYIELDMYSRRGSLEPYVPFPLNEPPVFEEKQAVQARSVPTPSSSAPNPLGGVSKAVRPTHTVEQTQAIYDALSPANKQLANLAAWGMTREQIAEYKGCKPISVTQELFKLTKLLHCSNTVEWLHDRMKGILRDDSATVRKYSKKSAPCEALGA